MASKITKHFTLEEFTRSATADKMRIANMPIMSQHFVNIQFTAFMLEIIRKQFNSPIRITSGYRCEELNARIGGSAKSYHLQGLAVDINCGYSLNKKLYETIEKLKGILPINELINEHNYSWIHVSFYKL